jgi:hypothetical protein
VVEADGETGAVYDLLHGGRRLSRQSSTTAWAARRNFVITVERGISRPKRPTPYRIDSAH